jgi:uncharacterized membrane protein
MTQASGRAALLTADEAAALEAQVQALEARVGSQVVVAALERSDRYDGLRWRAFAGAVSLAGLGAVLFDETRAGWPAGHAVLLALVPVLGLGAAAALLATFLSPFARLFLESARADREVARRAEALFVQRELFATQGRDALLLLVSRFERRAALYADRGLRQRIPAAAWAAVTAPMNRALAAGRTAEALRAGLDAAEPLLAAHPAPRRGVAANELPDAPIATQEPR